MSWGKFIATAGLFGAYYILGIKGYNIPPEIAGLVTLTKDSLTVQ